MSNENNKNIIGNLPNDKVIVRARDVLKKLRSPKDYSRKHRVY